MENLTIESEKVDKEGFDLTKNLSTNTDTKLSKEDLEKLITATLKEQGTTKTELKTLDFISKNLNLQILLNKS